jgi:hypothetical protein
MTTRLAYTRIAEPPTDCAGCTVLNQVRALCGPCRTACRLPNCWQCGDKTWTVLDGGNGPSRWGRCTCTTIKEARNEE